MNTGHQYLQQLILCKAPKLSRIVPRSKLFRGVPKMTRLYKFCKFCKLLLRNTNKLIRIRCELKYIGFLQLLHGIEFCFLPLYVFDYYVLFPKRQPGKIFLLILLGIFVPTILVEDYGWDIGFWANMALTSIIYPWGTSIINYDK